MELLPLVCLCLLSCSGDGVRVVVEEDSDAVLPCLISTREDITEFLTKKVFDWRKDESREEVFFHDSAGHTTEGAGFIGRVSFLKEDQLQNGDASIKITKTKMADSGNYSCDFPKLQSQTFNIELVVGAAPEPIIKILKMTKNWILLQCEAHGDPLPTVEWKDSDDNTLNADTPQVSERGGRSYITVKTTVTKADNYSCVATQETISHQIDAVIPVTLEGAASKPSVTTIKTDDGTVLQCEVLGASPKPKVEWKDSSGNILPVKDLKVTERGDSYDIVLQAALTKTDMFRCVVTQEEINHQIYAEIYLTINGSNTGLVIALVAVSLLLVGVGVLLAVLQSKGCITVSCKNDEEKREPQTEPNSSTSLKESS